MQFRIGSQRYDVRIVEEPLYEEGGREVPGKASWRDGAIFLRSYLNARQRRETLLHEFRHLWVLHHGKPADDEGDASAFATATTEFLEQYDRQGGIETLTRLGADGVVSDENADDEEPSTASYGGECTCGQRWSQGDVVNGRPFFDEERRALVLRRHVSAECGHLIVWLEGCTSSGKPNGKIKDGPNVMEGAMAAGYLNRLATAAH